MFNLTREGEVMDNVTTVGIDLAKNVFSVHGVNAQGAVVLRRTVTRTKLPAVVAQLAPCLIGLEACSGAHEWARPTMRFVPIKSLEQQSVLALHRVRQGFVEERTATINRVRGLLAEFGVVIAQRAIEVRRQVPALLERLPSHAARCLGDLLAHLRTLDERVREYEGIIATHAQHDAGAQLVQQRASVGPITASALIASVGDAHELKNGRQFSAWLGLVPRQYSTGGKVRLGHITRRGDGYLRTLLIMGARSVLQRATRAQDPLSRWALALKERRGYHRTCVAIAAKNARVIWALLAHQRQACLN
jgi:transposase